MYPKHTCLYGTYCCSYSAATVYATCVVVVININIIIIIIINLYNPIYNYVPQTHLSVRYVLLQLFCSYSLCCM